MPWSEKVELSDYYYSMHCCLQGDFMKLELSIEGLEPFIAKFQEDNSETITGLIDSLPIESTVNRWGDEIYFYVDFQAPLDSDARAEMKIGEIAYWPQGPALAIFFGPTPLSSGKDPVAASACNVIGKVSASADALRKARNGAPIRLRMPEKTDD